MPLSDDDRAEIAQLIADNQQTRTPLPPARRGVPARPAGDPSLEQSDWDRMSQSQQRSWVRQITEERLAELDAEAERENLRAENEELRRRMAEWEKGGRQGRRPTKADGDKSRPEEAPTLVGKAYRFLFGEVGSNTKP